MNFRIDRIELPPPAIETYRRVPVYRAAPLQSLDLEVDFDDTATGESEVRRTPLPPPSDRLLRTRAWSSED